ncbi:MAG: hypothetical protein QOJ09_359 [Actinomycetota bacterium]|jgi:hypothetical protein|nr:hypothetical protein [Actinomycetota bacterium]
MDRSFYRVGGAAAVVGGILALVGNLLAPRWTNINDVDRYRKIADSGIWRADGIILVFAIILITAGTVAVARSLEGGGVDGLAVFGRLAAVVGASLALLDFGVTTYAIKEQATAFAGATGAQQVPAFWATNGLDHFLTALFNTWSIVLLGVAPLLLGLAVLRTRRYPTWLGWAAVVGGIVCAGTGTVGLLRSDQDPLVIPFVIGSVLVTIWGLGAGWSLWQRQDVPDRVAA